MDRRRFLKLGGAVVAYSLFDWCGRSAAAHPGVAGAFQDLKAEAAPMLASVLQSPPFQKLWAELDDPAERGAPASWSDDYLASRFSVLTINDAWGQSSRIGSLKSRNPKLAIMLYTLMTFPYAKGDSHTPPADRLHNAAGRMVASDDAGNLRNLLDVWNPMACQRAAQFSASYARRKGFTGLYLDGRSTNRTIGDRTDTWRVWPDPGQISGWWQACLTNFYPAVRAAAQANGLIVVTNTGDFQGGPTDDAVLPFVDGTYIEGWMNPDWGAAGNWEGSVKSVQRNVAARKILGLNRGGGTKYAMAAIAAALCLGDGAYVWVSQGSWDRALVDESARDVGMPLGAMQDHGDRVSREFSKVRVSVAKDLSKYSLDWK